MIQALLAAAPMIARVGAMAGGRMAAAGAAETGGSAMGSVGRKMAFNAAANTVTGRQGGGGQQQQDYMPHSEAAATGGMDSVQYG